MKRILIADDSFTAREIVSRILGTGFEIKTAGNGEEALAKVKECPPDLILLDLLMPVMDGFGVLERLKAEGNAIPVIVLSADIQKSTREKVLSLGAHMLLNKPVEPETLRAIIETLLGVKKE